jgi:hypothetical protein
MDVTCALIYDEYIALLLWLSSADILKAVGNIIGLRFLLSSQLLTYPLGISAMLVAFALMAVTGVVHHALCNISRSSVEINCTVRRRMKQLLGCMRRGTV